MKNSIKLMLLMCVVVLTAGMAFAAVADLVGQITDCDADTKHTAPSKEIMDKLCAELLEGGKKSVGSLIFMIGGENKVQDYKARYFLHAAALYSTYPDRIKERLVIGDALISALGSDADAIVMLVLIEELQFLRDERAVKSIAPFLLKKDLCDTAARALVSIGKLSSGELAKALPKVEGRNKLTIIQALGDLRDGASAKALIKILESENVAERASAASALARIADSKSMPAMIKAFGEAEGHAGDEIADACFRLVDELVAAGQTKEARAIYREMWGAMKESARPHVRSAIVEGISGSLKSESTKDLAKELKSRDSAIRCAVLSVLGTRSDDEKAFKVVESAVDDKDQQVRVMATKALGDFGGGQAAELLVGLLPGDSIEMRNALRVALEGLEGDDVDKVLAGSISGVKPGKNTDEIRIVLLRVAAQRKARPAADAALKLARADEQEVRTAALKALKVFADAAMFESLAGLRSTLKESKDTKLLEDVLYISLKDAGDQAKQMELLSPYLMKGASAERCTFVSVLGRLGTDGSILMLVTLVKDSDQEVQDQAVRSLVECPNMNVMSKLLEIAMRSTNVKHQALALRGYIDKAVQERNSGKKFMFLKGAMTIAKRPEEKRQILGAIGNSILTVRSLEYVRGYLDDAEVQEEAAGAVCRIAERLDKKHSAESKAALQDVIKKIEKGRNRAWAERVLKKL